MAGRSPARGLDEGRRQVDRLDQAAMHTAAPDVGGGVGIVDDQRNTDALLVEQLLLAEPVIAEIIAMIAGHHDHGSLEQATLLEETPQPPEMIVDLLDQA